MAKTIVKLYMTNETIEFGSESIVSLEFEQQSTSDYSRPVYDVYPAYGTLVVKDKDLKLYNKALNGEFDNYNYKVEVFVNNSKVARLYITELPIYSFEDKTLSMVLGDELTKANTKIYSGYDYPFQPQTLYEIALAVLKAFDGTITVEEAEKVFTQSKWSDTQTYTDYLQTISIEYPYIPAKLTFRQVFKQLLTIAQSAFVTDAKTIYRLVRMDGGKSTANGNAIMISSEQTTSQFKPTIIVPNKYDSCDVDCDRVVEEYNKDSIIATHVYSDRAIVTTKTVFKDKTEININASSAVEQSCTEVYFSWNVEDLSYSSSTSLIDELPISYNNNLNKIQNFEKVNNKNPAYQLTIKKAIKRVEGTVDYTKSGGTYRMVLGSFSETEGGEVIETEEYIKTSALPKIETFTYSPYNYGHEPVTASIETDSTESKYNVVQSADGSKYINTIKAFLGRALTAICAEFNQYLENGTVVGDAEPLCAYKYIIKYEFVNLSITYNGDYTEIVFKDDTATVEKTTNVKDNTALISDGGELMQYSASKANSRPMKISQNTLKVFEKGLNGGDIECIAWDYYYYNKTALPPIYYTSTEDNKRFFSVGDMVVPCKDRKGAPVYTRNNAIVFFIVVKNEISFLNGGFKQKMILRESVRDISKIKLNTPTIGTFGLHIPRYSVTITNLDEDAENIIFYVDGNEIGTISTRELQRSLGLAYFVISQLNGWKGLTVGTHSITIKLTAQGLTDSNLSNSGSMQRGYDITYNLSHVSLLPVYLTREYYNEINQNESLILSFQKDAGYALPNTITVTNATYTWSINEYGVGEIALSNVTGNVLITISAIQSQITPVISLYGGTTIAIEQIDERAQQISVRANDAVIGAVAKLPPAPEAGAPLVTAKTNTEIEVDDINANAQKLAIYANGIKIGEVEI